MKPQVSGKQNQTFLEFHTRKWKLLRHHSRSASCAEETRKSILLSSCKRVLQAETQTEKQKVLGEVTSPGSTACILGSPKVFSSGSSLQIQEPNPSLTKRFGLDRFALQLHWRKNQRQETCRDLLGIVGPSSNPGLGILMNSREKKYHSD